MSNLINNERSKANLKTLPYANELQWIADERAKELILEHQNGTVHHGLRKYDPNYCTGEIAVVNASTAESAVNSWMNSPRHKDWILYDTSYNIATSMYYDEETGMCYGIAIFRYMHHTTHTYAGGTVVEYLTKYEEDGSHTFCDLNMENCHDYTERKYSDSYSERSYDDGRTEGCMNGVCNIKEGEVLHDDGWNVLYVDGTQDKITWK